MRTACLLHHMLTDISEGQYTQTHSLHQSLRTSAMTCDKQDTCRQGKGHTCQGPGRSRNSPSARPCSSSGKPSSSMLRCFTVMMSPIPVVTQCHSQDWAELSQDLVLISDNDQPQSHMQTSWQGQRGQQWRGSVMQKHDMADLSQAEHAGTLASKSSCSLYCR